MGNLFSFSPRAQIGDVNNNLTIRGPFMSFDQKSGIWECLVGAFGGGVFLLCLWISMMIMMITHSFYGKMAVSYHPLGTVFCGAALLVTGIIGLGSIINAYKISTRSLEMRQATIMIVSSSVLLSLVNYMGWFNQNTSSAWDIEYLQAFR